MRITYFYALLVIGGLLMMSCNNRKAPPVSVDMQEEQMHREHTNLADNLAHQGIIVLEERYTTIPDFASQINLFFGSYLKLEEALVNSDTIAANSAALEMNLILGQIPDPHPDEAAMRAWTNHKKTYLKNLSEFLHIKGLDEKRSYFSHISEILYCTFKSFDLKPDDIQMVYCPMAFDNKGAYWLTVKQDIRNPYFGDKMLKCGSIVETIP